jgi:hypothetical protein
VVRSLTGVSSGGVVHPLIVLGTPLFLTCWMLFHPSPYDDFSGELMPVARWWIVLHAVQFVLFAFMGAAVWLLVEGLRGIAAAVARVPQRYSCCSTTPETPSPA